MKLSLRSVNASRRNRQTAPPPHEPRVGDRVRYMGVIWRVDGVSTTAHWARLWRLPPGSRLGLEILAEWSLLERVRGPRRAA
jgi:hypothetical protein